MTAELCDYYLAVVELVRYLNIFRFYGDDESVCYFDYHLFCVGVSVLWYTMK